MAVPFHSKFEDVPGVGLITSGIIGIVFYCVNGPGSLRKRYITDVCLGMEKQCRLLCNRFIFDNNLSPSVPKVGGSPDSKHA